MIYSQKNGARTNRYELHDSDKMDSSGAEEICANRNRFSVLKFTSCPLLIFTLMRTESPYPPLYTPTLSQLLRISCLRRIKDDITVTSSSSDFKWSNLIKCPNNSIVGVISFISNSVRTQICLLCLCTASFFK